MLDGPNGLTFPLDALVTVYAEALEAVRGDLTARLRELAGQMPERALANLCQVFQPTIHRWLTDGLPEDAATLAALRKRLAATQPALLQIGLDWVRIRR